ncbi:MAG: YoaP domain-containing protein [Chitinivibrionales bacterium]
MNLKPQLVELTDACSAQKSPCAFGTFCILYKGNVISHHPISNTRFANIIKSIKDK